LNTKLSLGSGTDTEEESSTVSESEVEMEPHMLEWLECASGGELDIYTCIGLSNGRDRFGARTRSLLPALGLLIFLQLILPALLMTYYTSQHEAADAEHSGWEFRIIGFGLYGYAVYSMYGAALDECRNRFLTMAVEYNISPWYTLPMLVGEFANAFTACILTTTLFFIFVTSTTPVDLVLNSLAINFLVSADNDFQEESIRDAAKEDFRMCMARDINRPVTRASNIRNRLIQISMHCCHAMRLIGVLGVGSVLAITFFLGLEEMLCDNMGVHLQRLAPFCESGGA